MPYNESDDVREICGISQEDAPDNVLQDFITKADRALINSITVQIRNEEMVGNLKRTKKFNIDGSNKVFYTYNYPLADTNADSSITTADITIYLWSTKYDESTKTEATISAINDKTGRIELETAPSTDYVWITTNYSYYYNEMDFELVKEASALLAGYMWARSEYFWEPETIRLGPLGKTFRVTRTRTGHEIGGLPYRRIYQEYIRVLNLLKKKPFAKTKEKEIERIQELEEISDSELEI